MSEIQNRAMLVSLSICMFSPKKTDKQATKKVIQEHGAAANAGKFVKQLLPEEALEAIKKLQAEIRDYHYSVTRPWTDEGPRILPSTLYLPYVDKMRRFDRLANPNWQALVETFLSRYDEFKAAARDNMLHGMYNEEDYPGVDRVKKKFKFVHDFMPFPEGADFRVDIPDEEMAALREHTENRVKEALEASRLDLWNKLAKPLQTMATSLGNPEGRIYDTVVSNLKDIVGLIPALNLTNDPALEKIRKEVQAHLIRNTPDVLRKSPGTRRETAEKANAILATMSGYLSGPSGLAPLELPELPPLPPEPRASVLDCGSPLPLSEPAIVPMPPAPACVPSVPVPTPHSPLATPHSTWRRRPGFAAAA